MGPLPSLSIDTVLRNHLVYNQTGIGITRNNLVLWIPKKYKLLIFIVVIGRGSQCTGTYFVFCLVTMVYVGEGCCRGCVNCQVNGSFNFVCGSNSLCLDDTVSRPGIWMVPDV